MILYEELVPELFVTFKGIIAYGVDGVRTIVDSAVLEIAPRGVMNDNRVVGDNSVFGDPVDRSAANVHPSRATAQLDARRYLKITAPNVVLPTTTRVRMDVHTTGETQNAARYPARVNAHTNFQIDSVTTAASADVMNHRTMLNIIVTILH